MRARNTHGQWRLGTTTREDLVAEANRNNIISAQQSIIRSSHF